MGKIEAEMFRHALMNFGDKFNQAEIDDIFDEFEVDDDGFLESKAVIGLFVAGGGEEEKEEEEGRQVNWSNLYILLFFSNLLNSNLYVKCFYIPSSRLIISLLG